MGSRGGKVVIRKSEDRGKPEPSTWLESWFTFNFDGYNGGISSWGPLHVLNEDRIKPGKGFGKHSHHNYEIFTYMIAGTLEHQDSFDNVEQVTRGMVQLTSAGSGISHSEINKGDKWIHLLQVWIQPNKQELGPNYETKTFPDSEKLNKLRLIISPTGEQDSITIHQDAKVYASIMEKGASTIYFLPKGRVGYLHLINGKGTTLTLNDEPITGGDGAFLTGPLELQIKSTNEKRAEFLLFDTCK